MKMIAVASTKGGVGKSTLVCALAVCAQEEGAGVGIIDVDPQGSTRDWHALRGSPEALRLLDGDTVADCLAQARAAKLDYVFCDTPPSVVNIIEPAIRQADLVVIPVRPSPLDLLAQDAIIGLVEEHGRPSVFVLNQVPPRTTYAEDAGKQLKKAGKVLPVVVGQRNVFAMAMVKGKTAAEVEAKSREEIAAVWQGIKLMLNSGGG
jgi:chromosome partitioning protein